MPKVFCSCRASSKLTLVVQQTLHFSAALAFEQSYGQVDGDSATVAELSALISRD